MTELRGRVYDGEESDSDMVENDSHKPELWSR